MRLETRRPDLANAILLIGGLSHFSLCLPAIGARGFPPINPIWYGVILLWPIPVLMSAYFDSFRFRGRISYLILYSFVTAFFTSGTFVTIVPRRVDPIEMLFGTVFIGPLYILISLVVETLAQFVYSRVRKLVVQGEEDQPHFRFSSASIAVGIFSIALIFAIPFGYKAIVVILSNSSAVDQANRDWGTNAVIFLARDSRLNNDYYTDYMFDPETGLERMPRMSDWGFRDRYNERIAELIQQQGLPSYSIRSIMPSEEDLLRLLDSDEMDLVETFPVDLNANIHLMRRGSLTGWGSTTTNSDNSLSIETPSGSFGIGGDALPVHTKFTNDVIFIRNGSNYIAAYLKDGRRIMSLSRHTSRSNGK